MPHRLILKVTKFQLPPPKRLGTVVQNILGGPSCPPPMSNRVNAVQTEKFDLESLMEKLQRSLKRGKKLAFEWEYCNCMFKFSKILSISAARNGLCSLYLQKRDTILCLLYTTTLKYQMYGCD